MRSSHSRGSAADLEMRLRALDLKEQQETESSSRVLFPWLERPVFSLECLPKLEGVWDKAMNGVGKDRRGRSL